MQSKLLPWSQYISFGATHCVAEAWSHHMKRDLNIWSHYMKRDLNIPNIRLSVAL